MNMNLMQTKEEIGNCFEAFSELRPHLKDRDSFTSQVETQQKEGYTLVAIFNEGQAAACVGFRVMTTLAWGKVLYIDDLITRNQFRGKGYGGKLLDYAIEQAKRFGCDQVHLDTGFARHAAHRVYVSRGFHFNCHHLALELRSL